MPSSDIELDVFHRRWHVRLLALLYEHNGARFVVMKHALAISADSLTRCLGELMAAGWVQKNPGYGHPLRPEYVLTDEGRRLARACSRFQAVVDGLDISGVVYRKWSVPSLIAIDDGITRFNDLRARLNVTPRALSQSLTRLQTAALISQHNEYTTTRRGTRVARAASELLT